MSDAVTLTPWNRCAGTLRVPGDKSISHRAVLFAALANGQSSIAGLSPGADVASSRAAVQQLGVHVEDDGDVVVVHGRGWDGLSHAPDIPAIPIDCGNSGTTARLLCGMLAGRTGAFRLIGDESLSRRPMGRVTIPLAAMGARFDGRDTLPLEIMGSPLQGRTTKLALASAQVKSCLILAALQAQGPSAIHEPRATRDHTERLLRAMGAPLRGDATDPTKWEIDGGGVALSPFELEVPGDPSSAAYSAALAVLLPDSELVVEELLLNPRRLGFVQVLSRMGAQCTLTAQRQEPEPVGTLTIHSSKLQGVTLTPDETVDAIDELPLLACVASQAAGETVIRGVADLRNKESDRITETVALLRAFGAEVEEHDDGLTIAGGARLTGATVDAKHDHRIAMCAAVLAALAEGDSALTGAEWVRISYPNFFEDLARLRQ
ncbi:MAG: 3-phosphoshikimate 1-carboxyvinyltransferase [Planctomycetota bacterium]|jgi:3-phosphoshikimate 1-carboxyvinyltransferase